MPRAVAPPPSRSHARQPNREVPRLSTAARPPSSHSLHLPLFPLADAPERPLRQKLPGPRHYHLQPLTRSAPDHHHVLAHTHHTTLLPCLDPIHIMQQHHNVSYFHFERLLVP